ncbi:hypothetical protein DPMN_096854 [Dreissena polymorpha]|uniref:Uncharacterized protein n=1 Tax=Dreissena polymorpha TaxID=45954 RepID=A0A9D4L968_DREPO|nr:hypothetical protein DPMN_096854 [Dreissena polymorpha]
MHLKGACQQESKSTYDWKWLKSYKKATVQIMPAMVDIVQEPNGNSLGNSRYPTRKQEYLAILGNLR